MVGTRDDLPPCGIIPLDLARGEAPAAAADFVRRRGLILGLGDTGFELPFAIRVEFLPAQKFVAGDQDGTLQRQVERIAAEQMAAVGADDVMRAGLRHVDERAVEDEAGFVGARAVEGVVQGFAHRLGQRDGLDINRAFVREFRDRERIDDGFRDLLADGVPSA